MTNKQPTPKQKKWEDFAELQQGTETGEYLYWRYSEVGSRPMDIEDIKGIIRQELAKAKRGVYQDMKGIIEDMQILDEEYNKQQRGDFFCGKEMKNMKVIKKYNQMRRDCYVDIECEADPDKEKNVKACDDRNMWGNVVPDWKCKECDKSTMTDKQPASIQRGEPTPLINYWRHFETITKHKFYVGIECWKRGLYWQGFMHDWSKYSYVEFFTSARFFQGDKTPIGAEKRYRGYSIAYLNHKAKNKHHWEYWVDFKDGEILACPIPNKYIVEMCCDMIGASKAYLKQKYNPTEPYNYFLKHSPNWHMHPKSMEKLKSLLKATAKISQP